MSKWKCEICNSEFENFQAQGFNNKIYCPLCYFKELNNRKDKEIERLKKIAHKMHLWIFLHSGDEQKVYDELGLTDEENAMLGYSGQFRIGGDDESE